MFRLAKTFISAGALLSQDVSGALDELREEEPETDIASNKSIQFSNQNLMARDVLEIVLTKEEMQELAPRETPINAPRRRKGKQKSRV